MLSRAGLVGMLPTSLEMGYRQNVCFNCPLSPVRERVCEYRQKLIWRVEGRGRKGEGGGKGGWNTPLNGHMHQLVLL